MARKQKAAAHAAESAALQNATQTLAETLAAALGSNKPQISSTELKVGIRNISDNTIGLFSPIAGEPNVDLHADLPDLPRMGCTAVISYAWWQVLRKSPVMQRGEIVRDDSVLGSSFTAGPPDRPEDLPESWAVNAIPDPVAWIQSFATESDLRAAVDRITNLTSLRRIRRVVDMELKRLERTFGDDPKRAAKALRALPALYQMLDQVITTKLERPEEV